MQSPETCKKGPDDVPGSRFRTMRMVLQGEGQIRPFGGPIAVFRTRFWPIIQKIQLVKKERLGGRSPIGMISTDAENGWNGKLGAFSRPPRGVGDRFCSAEPAHGTQLVRPSFPQPFPAHSPKTPQPVETRRGGLLPSGSERRRTPAGMGGAALKRRTL